MDSDSGRSEGGDVKSVGDRAESVTGYPTSSAEADAWVHQIARDWRKAALSDVDRELCRFATRVTRRDNDESDLQRLRREGLDDVAIHDAAQVIAYFNYITRIADSLGVEPESFIRPWGEDQVC